MNGDSPERECQKEGCINTRKNLLNHIDRTRQQNSQLERFSKVSEEVQTLKMKLVETKACLESTSLKMQELTNAKEIAEAELKQLQSASEVDKRRILILQAEADEAEKHKETANYWREKYDSMGALAEKLEENNEEIKGKYEKTVRTMELLGKRTIALQDKLAKLKLAKGEGDGRHRKIEKYLESAIEVIDALSTPSNLSKLPKSISDKVNVFRRDDVRLHFNSMPWTASGPSEDVATNSEAHLSDDDEDDDDVEHLEQLLAQKIQKSPPKRRQKPRVVNSEDVPPEKWPRGIRKPTLEDSGGILDSRKVHSKRIVTSDFDVIAEATERRKKALKVGGANAEDSGASGNSGATIHGKKGKSVRETQSEMMKGETIKEKVARMRREKEMPPIPVQSTSTSAEKPAKTNAPPNPAESSKPPGAPEIRKSRTYNLSERSSDGESIGRRRRISEISDFSPETPQPLRRSGRLASQPSTPARTKNSKNEMPSMPPPSTRKSQSVRTRSTSQMEAATCSQVQDSDDVRDSMDRAAAGAEMIVPEVVVLDSEVLEISEIQISQTPTSSEGVHVAPKISEDVTIEISTSKESEDVTKNSTLSESSNVEISTSHGSEDVPNDYSPVLSDSEDVAPQNSAPECSTSSAESTAPSKNSEDVNLKIPKSPKQLIVSKYGLDISDSEEEDLEEAPPTSGPSISEAPPTSGPSISEAPPTLDAPPTSVPLTAEAPPLSGSLLPEAPPTSGPSTAEAPPTSGPLVPETPPTSGSSIAEAPPLSGPLVPEKSVQSEATPPQKAPPTDNFFDDILSGARSSASSSSSTTAPPTSGPFIAEAPPTSGPLIPETPPTLESSSLVKSAQAKATPLSTTVPPQAPPPIIRSRSQKAPPTQAPPTTDNFFDDILSGARSSASSSTTAVTAKKQAPPTKSKGSEAPPTKLKNPEALLPSKAKAPPTSGPLVAEAPPTSGPLIAEAPPTSSEAPLTSKSKAPPTSGPLVAEATPTSSEAPPTKSDAQTTSSEAPPTSPTSESDDTDEAPPTFKRRTSRISKATPTSSEAPPTKSKAPEAPPTSSEATPTFKKRSQSVKAPPTESAKTEAPPTISDDQRTSKSMAPPTSGPLIAEAPATSSNAPPTSPTSQSDDADEAPPTFKRRTSRIPKATPTSSESPPTKSKALEAPPTSKSKPKEVSEAPPTKSKALEAPPTSKSKPTKVSEAPPSSSDSESDDTDEAPPIFKRRTSRMSKATPTSSDAPPTKSKVPEAPPPTFKKRSQSVKAPPTSSGSDDILDDIISGARNSVKSLKKQAPPTKQKVSETPSTSAKAPPTSVKAPPTSAKAPPTSSKAPPTKRKTSSEDEQPAKRGKTTSEEEPTTTTTTTTSKILKGPKSAIMIEAPPLKRGRPPKVKLPPVMEKGTKKIGVLKAHFRQALDLKVEVNILAQKMKEKGIILGDSIPLQPADAVDVMMEFLRQTSAGDTWAALIRQLDQNLVPLKNTEEENFLQVSCSLNEDSDTLLELFIERILCEISFRDSMDSKQTCRLARLFCHAVFFSRKSLEDSDESSDDVIVKKSTWIRQFLRIIFLKNAANLPKSLAFCLISDAGKYCRWIGDEIMENGESEFNFPFRILMHKDPEQATVINKILNSKFEVAYIGPPTKEDVITKFREIHRKFVDVDEFSIDSSIFMSKTAEAECLEVAFDFLKIEMNRIEKQFIDPKSRGEKLKHKTVFSLPTVATKMTLEEAESLKKEMKWQKTVLLVMIDNSMTDHWKAIMKALREISPNIVALREIVESSEIDQFAESTALEPLREAVEHISDLISKFTNFPLLSKN